MNKFFILINIVVFGPFLQAQSSEEDLLKAGPMLGYSEMKEASVWIQTKTSSTVFAKYFNVENRQKLYYTDTLITLKHSANTATLLFTEVDAATKYEYQIIVNGISQHKDKTYTFKTQENWAHRADPPAFTMAMGSCVYINETKYDRPGKPYGGEYEIFESIASQKPDLMLWLGDNTYLRPADWTSRTGYLKRYTHTRSLPQLQTLLSTCNHYAIWDDHEFGPNDASGSWTHKDWALESFKLFWPNPSFGLQNLEGTTTAFTYNDMDFFLLDNRTNRTADFKVGDKHIFGRIQSDWLIDALKSSKAPYKFVATGSQFLNTAKVFENHSNFEEERNYILKRIEEEGIEGVIFLSGDRHHSEVMELKLPNGIMVREFTTSPLTASATNKNKAEGNQNRIKGSCLSVRNFSTLEFAGKIGARTLNLRYYNSAGKMIYQYNVN